jgi:hypothetical protein
MIFCPGTATILVLQLNSAGVVAVLAHAYAIYKEISLGTNIKSHVCGALFQSKSFGKASIGDRP